MKCDLCTGGRNSAADFVSIQGQEVGYIWLLLGMEDNSGCIKSLIFGAVWLGGGFVNIVTMTMATGDVSGFAYLIRFALPGLSFILAITIMQGKDFLKWIFRRKTNAQINNAIENPKRSYGSTVIVTSVLVFGLGGLLSYLFADPHPHYHKIHLVFGLIWGILWYIMFQTKIINHLEVD